MKQEPTSAEIPEVPFVNEMRLGPRHWLAVVGLLFLVAAGTPRLWKRIEKFETGPDYRIPYSLSKDYWLYQRRLQKIDDPSAIFVLGDSVVWGEYVAPDGTLSHFLNAGLGGGTRFVNAGVNGMFPLALEGLADYYGGALGGRKVLLQCNVLWMSSPKADLSVQKEEKFNHSRLVPQFSPRIPCYKADANERLGAVAERNLRFNAWVNHLQSAYFGDKSVLSWTLMDDGSSDPPRYPNSYKNPFAQIGFEVPSAPAPDPQRGPASPRHKAWNANGGSQAQFEWVDIQNSLQWAAFRRLVEKLRSRGADVMVLFGPFNEHIVGKESQPGYQALRSGILAWLDQAGVPHLAAEILPSALYADASHPLTDGYKLLAEQLWRDGAFQKWAGHQPK